MRAIKRQLLVASGLLLRGLQPIPSSKAIKEGALEIVVAAAHVELRENERSPFSAISGQ